MPSIKFSIDDQYSFEKIRYLDQELYKYAYLDKKAFPSVLEKLDFSKLNFIFELKDIEDEDVGYSLVCTKSHRKKATKSTIELSENGDLFIFKIVASIDIPLRVSSDDIKSLKLCLKRIDFAKGTPAELNLESDNLKEHYIPFYVE